MDVNCLTSTLNSVYNKVTFNEKSAITKENLCTKYFPFTHNYVALNEKPPIIKENLRIFFFVIGGVECSCQLFWIQTKQINSVGCAVNDKMVAVLSSAMERYPLGWIDLWITMKIYIGHYKPEITSDTWINCNNPSHIGNKSISFILLTSQLICKRISISWISLMKPLVITACNNGKKFCQSF